MNKVKVRKIGNSLGVILPKESGVHEGDLLDLDIEADKIILGKKEAQLAQDRAIIEKAFEDVDNGKLLTEADMARKFGKYGWHD